MANYTTSTSDLTRLIKLANGANEAFELNGVVMKNAKSAYVLFDIAEKPHRMFPFPAKDGKTITFAINSGETKGNKVQDIIVTVGAGSSLKNLYREIVKLAIKAEAIRLSEKAVAATAAVVPSTPVVNAAPAAPSVEPTAPSVEPTAPVEATVLANGETVFGNLSPDAELIANTIG